MLERVGTGVTVQLIGDFRVTVDGATIDAGAFGREVVQAEDPADLDGPGDVKILRSGAEDTFELIDVRHDRFGRTPGDGGESPGTGGMAVY